MYEKLIKALKRAAQKPEIKPALLLEAAGAIERLERPAWISAADRLPAYFVQVATTNGRSAKIRYLLNSGGVDLWGPDLMPLTVVTRWAPIPALPEEIADDETV